MSEHERYHVNLAGIDICVDCSDRCGFGVPWETAVACRHSARLILAPPPARVTTRASVSTYTPRSES